jgi:hypothetical protein
VVLELAAVVDGVPTVPDAPPVAVDAPVEVVETAALVVATDPLAVEVIPVVADAPMPVVVVPALVLGAVPLSAAPFELSDSAGLEQAWCRQLSNPSNSSSDTDRSFTVLPAGARTTLRRLANSSRGWHPENPVPSRGSISAPPRRNPQLHCLSEGHVCVSDQRLSKSVHATSR